MPVEWLKYPEGAPEQSGALSHCHNTSAPLLRLSLWPYRSLPRRTMAGFLAVTCALITLPLLALLGSPVFWGLLPFLALTIAGVWYALERSFRDGTTLECLTLWSDRIELVQQSANGTKKHWHANPYWVSVNLYKTDGPVPNYVTLKSQDREVEIGAFLSEEERVTLHHELLDCLRKLS